MSKYRIVETRKEGHYKYYEVQERTFFIWDRVSSFFDTIEEAEKWIKFQKVQPVVRTVVG